MSASQDTKIELVTEAIETLVLAQVVALDKDQSEQMRQINHEQLCIARETVREALKVLVTPSLRVLSNNAPQSNPIPPLAKPVDAFPDFKPKSIDDLHGPGY